MLFPDNLRTAILALHPTADRLPESSLSQMISWCVAEFGASEQLCAATPYGVDVAPALKFLRDCEQSGRPVCIMGTTASLGRLFEVLEQAAPALKLSRNSRLMDTGGAKGQAVPLAACDVIELAEQRLGLDREKVINEYGMTELCSQLYDATAFNSSRRDAPEARVKLPPPWLRPFIFDPATLHPMPRGARGLLGFFDLANALSVSMIVTEDLGVVEESGGVRLEGRASSAGARGCALAIKEFAELERGA